MTCFKIDLNYFEINLDYQTETNSQTFLNSNYLF